MYGSCPGNSHFVRIPSFAHRKLLLRLVCVFKETIFRASSGCVHLLSTRHNPRIVSLVRRMELGHNVAALSNNCPQTEQPTVCSRIRRNSRAHRGRSFSRNSQSPGSQSRGPTCRKLGNNYLIHITQGTTECIVSILSGAARLTLCGLASASVGSTENESPHTARWANFP